MEHALEGCSYENVTQYIHDLAHIPANVVFFMIDKKKVHW